jgi:hypothetical protein
VICAFCGKTFDPDSATSACRNCASFGGCKKVKCPHCGYDMPAETKLGKWLRKKLDKSEEKGPEQSS